MPPLYEGTMNIRQYKYKCNRVLGMSQENAALAAGYSANMAAKKAYKIERAVNAGIKKALEQAGLTDKVLAQHAVQGLQATKVVSAVIVGKDATDKTDDFIDVPDWSSRHKYYDTVLKVTGRLKATPDSESNVNFTKMGDVIINNQVLEYKIGSDTNKST